MENKTDKPVGQVSELVAAAPAIIIKFVIFERTCTILASFHQKTKLL